MDVRAAEIEAGARWPVADLVVDVEDGADRFEAAVRSLPPVAWHAEVRMRTGELRTPGEPNPTRLRELEIHHADPDAGYGFSDIPAEAAPWIIGDIADALARRQDTPALRLEATDSGFARTVGSGSGPTVSGRQADLLAWTRPARRGVAPFALVAHCVD
ncbi:maleylpyruvate isomerase family mycothiol-dependent enzyme [Streptomyces sp. NPDC018610]|uniref:maleylpyruvate isomerase family mycothiol-dependent enzyme n=1 Tax=Streptomyces sp. NPDC018610 TaxID=3365049 RepID=UPI003789BDC6